MNTLSFLKDKQMLTAIKNSVDAAQHIECQQCRQKLLLEVKPMINHLKQAVAENDPRAHETLQKVYKTASALFSSECTSCRRRLI
jgi:DNA-directed RNA polymerase subunit RPC12/RpoP